MVSVTPGRERRRAEDADQSAAGDPSASAESEAVDREAALRSLAAHAGEVATEERQRALRTLDGDVSPAVRRALSTLAVRVTVGAVAPAATAIKEGDDGTAATVSRLFSPEQ